jgi:fatty acid desaturase
MTSTAFEQTAQDATQSLLPSLSAEDTRLLRQRSNVMGAYLVLHAWGLIGGAMALCAAWPHPLSFLLAFVVIGNRQLGLAVLMHDAAHRLLFENATLNDWVGHWLCGAPVGASLKLYRPYHLSHHRHTQQEQDPDLMLSAPFPITVLSLRRKVVRDLLGMTGYQRRAAQFRAAMGDSTGFLNRLSALWKAEKSFFVSNFVLCAALAWMGIWWVYPVLWVLPMLTWYQLISRLRNIAEHAVVGPANDPLRNTRTTYAGPLMRLILAPYWVNYHLEHHLFAYTPCWKLARAHRMLRAQGLLDRMEVAGNYLEVLRKATSAAPGSDTRGPRRSSVSHI